MQRGRHWAAVLAALLTVGTFAGCGSGHLVKLDPQNPVSIEIWHHYNGPQKAAFDEMIVDFNQTVGAEKGIVVMAFSQGTVTQLAQKIVDAADQREGAGHMPDAFTAQANLAYEMDQRNLVASLDGYLTQREWEAYIPAYLAEGRMGAQGDIKIFPIAKSTEIMMINKTDWDAFAADTGAQLDELATVEGLVRVAQRYYEWTDASTSAPEDGKAFFGRDAMANYMLIGSRQLGVELFSIHDGALVLNLDKDVMRKLWDNYYLPYINGYFTANGRFRSDDIRTGDILALVGSTSGAAYFPQKVMVSGTQSDPIEVQVMPAPLFEGGQKYAVQQGAGMVVTKSTQEKEYAAVVFLKWFTDSARSAEFCIESGYLPVRKDANTQAVLQEAMAKDANLAENLKKVLPVAAEVVNTHQMYASQAFDNGDAVRNVLETALQEQAETDRAKVQEAIRAGKSRQQAVEAFATDAHFDQWYEALQQKLKQAAGQ